MYTEMMHGLVTHLSLTGNSLKGQNLRREARGHREILVEEVMFLARVVTFHTLKHPVPNIASDLRVKGSRSFFRGRGLLLSGI